jgi:hypothetical protein
MHPIANVCQGAIKFPMENSSHTEAKRALDLDDRPTSSVVIIYQDRDTGRRAKCFYDKMTHELDEECDFSLELWNFEMLTIPEMRDSSAQAAAQADFLVLSFHGNAELPAQTRYWIERWSRLSANGNTALVALVEKPKTGRGTAVSTLSYLRSVAAIKGIDFSSITFSAETN